MRDERLEALSDNVRKGIPVNFKEALEVIEYQNKLKADKPVPKKGVLAAVISTIIIIVAILVGVIVCL